MKQRILFSALGGSLFPTLKNYLDNDYEIFFHDSNSDLQYEYPDYNFLKSPKINSKKYIPFLKKYIKSKKIEVYVPLIDEELKIVKKEIEGYMGVKVISPSKDFIKLCLNKLDLMKKLSMENISNIDTYEFSENKYLNQFPYIIKPIYGRGSRGVRLVYTKDSFFEKNHNNQNLMIQKFISGDEYSVGVNVNNLNQILSISSRKIIEKKGITIKAITAKKEKINKTVKLIVDRLKPCGPFNVQLIIDKQNSINIFEINPRFSTTLLLSYYSGINEIRMYLFYYNKKFKNKLFESRDNLYLKRRWENILYEI